MPWAKEVQPLQVHLAGVMAPTPMPLMFAHNVSCSLCSPRLFLLPPLCTSVFPLFSLPIFSQRSSLLSTTNLPQTRGREKFPAAIAISSPLMWLLDKTVKIRFSAICFICEFSRVFLSPPDTSLAKLPGRSGYF